MNAKTSAVDAAHAAKTPAAGLIAISLLDEFEAELGTTRRFLERIPEDGLEWRPHAKSMTAGQLALHIAQTPRGVLTLALPDEAAPPDFSGGPTQPRSLRDVLEALEDSAAFVRETLPGITDERMRATFTISAEGRVVMAMQRVAFLRSIMFNHLYHHRGQLGVYLRLLGAAVPSSYGPSADESPF